MRITLSPMLAAACLALPHVLGPTRSLASGSTPAPGDRVQVLFLGDDGHHRPAERVAEAQVPLFRRGVQLEYTEDLADLTAENLARFEAVVIYANHTAAAPERMDALLEFVRGGGGLVALHCASYCFLDSPAYLELVGARFESHGTGTFSARDLEPEHPLQRGLAPFTSWDETYVHRHVADDRTILSVRDRAADEPGGAGPEPWTWVRREGRGRVFYTASGHDGRTWNQEGFLDLVARGVRWAAGREDPGALPDAPPFTYLDVATGIPDFVPGRPTGTSHRMQAPLSPEASGERLAVAPGLEARLFASEPLLQGKPVHLAFDARGRAWVLETVDYPNERRDQGGRDRIVILEDSDGDGLADRRQVFAEDLSIPTSLAFANGGVVVLQAPETLFLRDTDGDDVADERSVLFRGWGTGDTHAGPSNLRYGPDNRLWATVGYSGFGGEVGGMRHGFAQAVLAFEPDGSRLELIASTTNNTWGLGFGEEGSVFASTANGNPSVHAAVPARAYERVPGFAPGALRTIAERMDLHPVTERVRQVDFHGKFTAAAGHAPYTARLLPRRYWNRIAFVNSPTGHTVGQFLLEHAGSDYVARDGWNLLASDDEWTAPILSEVGPDGAVWVIDWYNYIVQHNPTPPGFETGAGNAYVSDLRDKVHGRIWRVLPADRPVPAADGSRDLEHADARERLAALADENLLWRLHAQRLLVESADPALLPGLLVHLETPHLDAVGNDPGALHALWTLDGLGAFDPGGPLEEEPARAAEDALVRALRHPAWGVRRAAVERLPRVAWARDTVLSSGLLEDPSAKVRLAALLALAEMPASDGAGAAALAALLRAGEEDDRWLADAATLAAAAHDAGFLQALLASPLVAAARAQAEGPAPNLVPNPSFEDGPAGRADAWQVRTYGGRAGHAVVDDVAHSGRRSLRITSDSGSDTSFFCEVPLEPRATYRVSAWIRTEELERDSGRGAQLNVHELQSPRPVRTEGLDGSADWRRVETTFEAQGLERVTINCLFGGWGWSRGTAWFDDLRLERLRGPLLKGPVGQALPLVMGAYAARGPVDSVVSTLGRLRGVPASLADAVLEGLEQGWPADMRPTLGEADRAALAGLARDLEPAPRARLAALLGRWGVDTRDVVDLDALTARLARAVADDGVPVAERVAAVERLVALGLEPAALAAVASRLDATLDPELAAGWVRALCAGRRVELGRELLTLWSRLGPRARSAAVAGLTARETWTLALLEAIAAGELPATALDPAQWTRLEQRLAGTEHGALLVRARGAAADPDRVAVVERHLSLLGRDGDGDAERGRAVFAEHCAKCHVLEGRGTAVGPALDGIGARAPEELLIAILDPNRSVEGTYQLWTARTRDGLLVAGRLVAETRTTVELLDTDGGTHLLQRDELEVLAPSALSLMPVGLEETVGEQGLVDLLAHLARQH